ncbi:hypothetical protein ACEYYH_12180 [Microbacterium trichothecenolyticum]|uniref:hypothetical protein n=1 Tax=Microbacterium trichothecenolyticum TaxID=69370 RepID=UPI0035BE2119
MTDHDQPKNLVRTDVEFDALPDDTVLTAIEIIDPTIPHWRRRTIWRKFGREWVNLDPSDRDNGATTKPGGYLANLLTGFGRRGTTPGVALVLGDGDEIAHTSLDQLARGAVIAITRQGKLDTLFTADGGGKFTEMDPADPFDGEFPFTANQVHAFGGDLRVLYRPGDEERP